MNKLLKNSVLTLITIVFVFFGILDVVVFVAVQRQIPAGAQHATAVDGIDIQQFPHQFHTGTGGRKLSVRRRSDGLVLGRQPAGQTGRQHPQQDCRAIESRCGCVQHVQRQLGLRVNGFCRSQTKHRGG